MILPLLVAISLVCAPISIRNGDFSTAPNGKPDAWIQMGQCRLVPGGGRNGSNAVELKCEGDGMNAAEQVLTFDPPRRGAFAVTAWVRCDAVGEGGDCAFWLDVLQAGGHPLWGQQGLPRRDLREWQQLRAEVRPTHPVREVQLYLILRNVRGCVRFCDVRAEDVPLEIRGLRVFPTGSNRYEVRASLSDDVDWRLRANQRGKVVWELAGRGVRANSSFTARSPEPVRITLEAKLNDQSKSAVVDARPRPARDVLDWWVADSATRVFQDDLPPQRPAKAAALDAARNDRESFQVCLRPLRTALNNVNVSVTDLTSGGRRIPAAAVKWQRVGYVWVEQPYAHPHADRREASWWPDPLLPAREFSIEAEQVQPLWFTVRVPPDAEPGAYQGEVTVRADGVPAVKVPVNLAVHRPAIPDQGYMKTAFALMDGHMEKLYGTITPQLRRAYTDYLLAHHLNPDDISRTTLPDLNELQYANTRGLNAFNILNVVPEPKSKVIWTCWSEVSEYTPEFRKRFFERLDEIVPRLERRGLIDKAYIYGFDERGKDYIPVIRDLFGEIKRRYPKVHTLSTCWPPAGTDPLSLGIDWYVPLSSSYDPLLAAKVRERGGEMWWYVCMGPNYPYANWLLENPLIEARLIWWQAFSHDVEGFLYWGLGIWERKNNDKPIPDSAGPRLDWSVTTGGDYMWLNGDGVLLYPGESGPIGSIRLENIRDGLEDIELLRQYRDRAGRDAAARLVRGVTPDRTHFSRDPADLVRARLAVLKALDGQGAK